MKNFAVVLFIVGWLCLGFGSLSLTARFGNQKPIHLGPASVMILGGPITFSISVLITVFSNETPCVANCKGE